MALRSYQEAMDCTIDVLVEYYKQMESNLDILALTQWVYSKHSEYPLA